MAPSKRTGIRSRPLAALLLVFSNLILGTGFSQKEENPLQQSPAPPVRSPALIHVSSNLVTVPVSVTDASGNPVDNLQAGDFKLEEDNTPEPIVKMVQPGQTPVELALLFDISGSVNPRFEFELDAATHFLKRVFSDGDSVSIVTVAEEPMIVNPGTMDLTSALESLHRLQPTHGMTAFYDSVSTAAHLLSKTSPAPYARRVVVVLSDGEDNNSHKSSLSDVLQQIQRTDCIFYAINPAGPSIRLNQISMRGQEGLESLASETGGCVFLPEDISQLEAIFNRIVTELRTQYLLEYYSSNSLTDGRFRKILVTVPGKPGLRIRARQGYYSPMG